MSFTDGSVDMELESIMNKNDSVRKRRRSLTAVDNLDSQHSDISPLIIKDLSLSPSERLRRPHTIGLATEDKRTNYFDKDDIFQVKTHDLYVGEEDLKYSKA